MLSKTTTMCKLAIYCVQIIQIIVDKRSLEAIYIYVMIMHLSVRESKGGLSRHLNHIHMIQYA